MKISNWLLPLFFMAGCGITVAQDAESPKNASGQPPSVTAEQPMSFWMEKKLDYSKRILEALTSGRYDEIEIQAEKMRVLGKIEGFVRGRSDSYATHLQSFDLAARELKRNAKAKNIEGATLAFNQLTTSCVTCHQSLRMTE